MKKYFLLFLSFIVFGCSNYIEDSVNISVAAAIHSSRSVMDESYSISSLEVWISDPGIDYLLSDPEEIQYKEDLFDDTTEMTEAEIDAYFKSYEALTSSVRYFSTSDNSIDFDITTNILRVFSVRVVFSSSETTKPDRVFIGYTQRAISLFTTTVEVNIYETATSQQIDYFSELDEFLESWQD